MKKAFLRLTGWLLLAGTSASIVLLLGVYLYLNPSLPNVDALRDVELQTPLRIFSADNKLIGQFGEKRRDPIAFSEAPTHLIDAILSAEDDGFYSHQGVDIKSLLRAASQLLISGSIQSGGSTITMQVARNFFLTRQQTFSRKFNEILLALKIENELNKQEILELYLNKIYLGNRAYGVKAAAQVYYGKPIEQLTLAQIAMIAGLPKAPSTYNPIVNPSRALIRRDWILGRMLSLGKITDEEYQTAIGSPVSATYHTQKLDLHAPYVAEIARDRAISLLGEKAYTGGYTIVTTIDSRLQQAGQTAVINGLLEYTQRHGYRGPEQQLSVDVLTTLTTAQGSPDTENPIVAVDGTQLGAVNLLPWTQALEQIPAYGNLQPAAVVSIDDQSITAILSSGEAVTIPWEHGLNRAGKYINENFYSPVPKTANKIVSLGDVIRLRLIEDKEGKPQWYFSQVPTIQGALVALNPKNGGIITVVGGFDFKQSAFNRATQAKRLPGSNFKPFIYSIGLENGLTAASIFNDAPVVIEDSQLEKAWRPENASGKFFGPTRLREALYLSRNLVSIRLLRRIGVDKVIDGIERFGVDKTSLPRDLSIALGTYVMTPLEIATGYSVFANNGHQITPFIIDSISDNQGTVIYREERFTVTDNDIQHSTQNGAPDNTSDSSINLQPLSTSTLTPNINTTSDIASNNNDTSNTPNANKPAPRVMDERITYIMNSILRDVVDLGTAKKAKALERSDIGGKTGTTNGPTDAWFSGFNQHIVATAWVGFDNNSNIGRREYGGTAALPIWIEFMREALQGIPEELPPQPNDIVTVRINPDTGQLTTPNNPNGIDEIFLKETVPTELVETTTPDGTENKIAPEDIF